MLPNIWTQSFVEWFIFGILLSSFFYIVMSIYYYIKFKMNQKKPESIPVSCRKNMENDCSVINLMNAKNHFDAFF